jgi:hypothetical protein
MMLDENFRSLAQLKGGGYAGVDADRAAIRRLIAATVFNFHTTDHFGRHWEGGSCRAAAMNNGAIVYGRSIMGQCHAEGMIIPQILVPWNGHFDYMYVDIEPCHSGRYGRDCKGELFSNFDDMSRVYYAFEQDHYETGRNAIFRRNEVQDQLLLLFDMAGLYDHSGDVALGAGR